MIVSYIIVFRKQFLRIYVANNQQKTQKQQLNYVFFHKIPGFESFKN
jgi:hypothetical protein